MDMNTTLGLRRILCPSCGAENKLLRSIPDGAYWSECNHCGIINVIYKEDLPD